MADDNAPLASGIDHIGIAVRELAAARRFYEEVLGLTPEGEEEIAGQGVRVVFYRLGGVRVELLQPLDSHGPVARFLEKRGEGVHHLAYRVADVDQALARAGEAGCHCLHQQGVAGAGGKRIGFVHPASCAGVLTEFCQAAAGGKEEESACTPA